MTPQLIWGAILVLFGLSLILKSLFNITIPLMRPFIGLVFIYLGLHLLTDPFIAGPEKKTVLLGKSTIQATKSVSTYCIALGNGIIDLSTLEIYQPTTVTINTIFGSSTILLDPHIPTKVTVNAVASRAILPDEKLISFGRNVYKTTQAKPLLHVHANVICGSLAVQHISSIKPKSMPEQSLQHIYPKQPVEPDAVQL